MAKVSALQKGNIWEHLAQQTGCAESVLFALSESLRMNIGPRRLSILSAMEVDGLYGLPRFTEGAADVTYRLNPEYGWKGKVKNMNAARFTVIQGGKDTSAEKDGKGR